MKDISFYTYSRAGEKKKEKVKDERKRKPERERLGPNSARR
jgi:hypothetical protein